MAQRIQVIVASCLILVSGTGIWLAASTQSMAALRIVPTPTRIMGTKPESDAQAPFISPGSSSPNYIISGPSFADQVLHWQQTAYSFVSSSPDPANGKIATADIWVRVGSNGIPEQAHITSVLPNGELWQEVVVNGTQVTIRLGKVFAPDPVLGRRYCKQEISEKEADLANYLPPFLDPTKLEQNGFSFVGAQTRKLPQAQNLPGISPTDMLSDVTWKRWQKITDKNNMSQTDILDVGQDGRVIFALGKLTHANGRVISETWSEYGDIQVFEAKQISTDIFDFSSHALEECHD